MKASAGALARIRVCRVRSLFAPFDALAGMRGAGGGYRLEWQIDPRF